MRANSEVFFYAVKGAYMKKQKRRRRKISPEDRARALCKSCVYNDLKKCGKPFCVMPRCINERVVAYAEGKIKSV